MNRKWLPLVVVLGFFLLIGGWMVSVNNTLIRLDEAVNEKRAQLENVYQRRMDLIPNLVNTVKAYAKHESRVFEEVAKARAQVGQVRVSGPEDLAQLDQAQAQLSSALSRLLVVAERYPDLKADKNFLELQSQLEGTENRITIERQRFNEASRDFNVYARRFPQVLIASVRGFKEKPYFMARPEASTAPKVEF